MLHIKREVKKAVYAGTFDPLTFGHLWMIEESLILFERLVIAIGLNPDKQTIFTSGERLEMLTRSTHMFPNIQIDMFTNQYLVEYATGIGAQYIVRGIRNESDYTYERSMRNINGDLRPNISTIFLMPPREIAEVSSSMVKGLVGPEGWENVVEKYVPKVVLEKLKEKHDAKSC